MKIFVSSVAALRTESRETLVVCIGHRTVMCLEGSQEDAEQVAMQKVLEAFPPSEGWYGHSVRPEAIDENLLDSYMALAAEKLMSSTVYPN